VDDDPYKSGSFAQSVLNSTRIMICGWFHHARSMLQRCPHLPDAVVHMMPDGAASLRQASRYLGRARRLKQPLPISDPKVAFTVKLSRQLVEQVRTRAQEAGLSLSELVSRALSALHQIQSQASQNSRR
jgi:hypothetical protein